MIGLRDAALRDAVAENMRDLGYTVVETRTEAELPQLLIGHEEWFEGGWLGLDVRTWEGRLSECQARRRDRGRLLIVSSVIEALKSVAVYELALGVEGAAFREVFRDDEP